MLIFREGWLANIANIANIAYVTDKSNKGYRGGGRTSRALVS